MTIDEKEDRFIEIVNHEADKLGMEFIIDSGEGRDHETEDLYLEDLSGWLFPKGTPEKQKKTDQFYRFAEWSIVDGVVSVDFKEP